MESAILLVDDEPNVLAALKRSLHEEPYLIHTARSGEEALGVILRNTVGVVVSDERMPGMSGVDFLSNVKRLTPRVVRMMLTGQASLEAAMDAVNRGEIYRFLTKPWNDMDLKLAIRTGLDRYRLEERNHQLLQLIKRQAVDLKALEHLHPDIKDLERDAEGRLVIPDVSAEEIDDLMKELEIRYGS